MQNPYRTQSKVNPQREKGRREIANDVFQALLSAPLSGGEYKVILVIIDRSWGFDKLSATISLKKYEKVTHISKQGIVDAIHSLEAKHIIVVERNGTKGTEYLFNKHYDTWEVPSTSQVELTSEPELVNQSGLAAEEALVKQSGQDLSSRVDKSSQVELTSTSQVVEPTTEPVKKHIKETSKETLKEKGGSSPPSLGPETPASRYLFEKTSRKRWQNLVQKEQFEKAESEVGEARMKEAIDWALTSGISNIKSMITASRRKKDGEPTRRDPGPRTERPDPHRRRHEAPTKEEYQASKEKYLRRKNHGEQTRKQ